MTKFSFSWLAAGISLVIVLVLFAGGALPVGAERKLPLLTVLILCEFGALVCVAGAISSFKAMRIGKNRQIETLLFVICLFLGLGLAIIGIGYWPDTSSA